MIEFKKTQINLLYLLSKFFDVDYDGKKFYCHRCHDIIIDRDYLYSMLMFNSESTCKFELQKINFDLNEVTIKSSFVEIPYTDIDAVITYSDDLDVVFVDGICEDTIDISDITGED